MPKHGYALIACLSMLNNPGGADAVESPRIRISTIHPHRWFVCYVGHHKLHGNVFTVSTLVNVLDNSLRNGRSVHFQVVPMHKASLREYNGEGTFEEHGPPATIQISPLCCWVLYMNAWYEANKDFRSLAPHLVGSGEVLAQHVDVVVHVEHGLRAQVGQRGEAVAQTGGGVRVIPHLHALAEHASIRIHSRDRRLLVLLRPNHAYGVHLGALFVVSDGCPKILRSLEGVDNHSESRIWIAAA
mmetsp:Transcript_26528/g.50136  ORF Transcript_26528/g.50136 Transcript_26528/m.50136 type:complete len:243 (+) Transcript_26528:83-811(+)